MHLYIGIFLCPKNRTPTKEFKLFFFARAGANCIYNIKPHPVYQAMQLDKRGAIHIYGGLQKRSGQTDFVYSFELVARKRCVFDCFYIIEDLRRL